MRLLPLASLWVAAAALAAGPRTVAAQAPADARYTWQLEGVRMGWCVQLLLDPASEAFHDLPAGYSALPASRAPDLHVSLRSVIDAQADYAGWSPSALCFYTVDTLHTAEFTLADRSGKHPTLLGVWTAAAADAGGQPTQVLLDLFTTSSRLVRAARRSGLGMREVNLAMGKVPAEDEEGRPSTDDRFQVKAGKTLIIWDGHPGEQGRDVPQALETRWAVPGDKGVALAGGMVYRPGAARPMIGSLKVEGKDPLAKALKASPSRFAGPEYRGGSAVITLRN